MGSVSGLPGPTDAWITLAGLASDTSTIRLGTMVTAATFRQPGPLAISVAGVDQMSGGRVELGIGAGWFETEHKAYGMPFPSLGDRFDNLEEQVEIIHGLWNTPVDETYSFAGQVVGRRGFTCVAQAGAGGRSAAHHRRPWQAPHPTSRGTVCRRVQPPVLSDRHVYITGCGRDHSV